MSRADTIFALSTPMGKSGVAVIRVSGHDALKSMQLLGVKEPVRSRVATCKTLYDKKRQPIDQAVVLYFPGPGSFTGEDVVELQVHGSLAVIRLLFEELQTVFRIAEPGEFSLRAFLNGKIDLTRAEGIADLVNSETEAQLRQAFAQSSGFLERLYEEWRSSLVDILSDLEAYIDFPDDVSPQILRSVHDRVKELHNSLERHLDDGHRGERLRHGMRVAILGKPNVGKSTLFNHLARRDMAIVSEYPGTTRDVLEAHVDIGGYPFIVVDTAGIRESTDFVEREGIMRAKSEAATADIRIMLFPHSEADNLGAHEAIEGGDDGKTIYVLSKADSAKEGETRIIAGKQFYLVSVHTNLGVDSLLSALKERAIDGFPKSGDVLITSQRHRGHLQSAAKVISDITDEMPAEIVAEYLRLATKEIGKVTGAVYGDDILDNIFKRFCIGK
ncbi:tRNA uridine-5-carboxymethylaminomethyl(34) synthesis GTPase MnmE [Anaplasma marginale]|uniref:tRNA modification GTPase MnmE n=1 Tax=Anaplasma marginale TaxID=770 RepID=A0A643CQG2_ANAMA|nr:tRNA uridine-5-carboxymethylaminomethyl(34) synthesis GTPase MnmE [Anaplasma marginale]AXW85417.1 tRNA uridine-5-carboxymethylaminomethyl(34) synthesis GTPase MnmE [Anaplasma marginale]KAA8472840.1 tRNA uridine-5-carboxymethylaminomethyl(34) synthesis GTPase MnmE [Anaplasma marginale]KAA8474948.1 tRNA uridine-5-carboxymethylaminomethyl(34) synthesis GTPase MnmE [Anaplasma marginale]KAB0451126.1 tRNA uridine-5-carboxymethylaminomethyl(34) synthesis GTPase MnmE [Anaplasma marginale]KAB0452595